MSALPPGESEPGPTTATITATAAATTTAAAGSTYRGWRQFRPDGGSVAGAGGAAGGPNVGISSAGSSAGSLRPGGLTDRTACSACSQRSRYSPGSAPHALTNSTVVAQ